MQDAQQRPHSGHWKSNVGGSVTTRGISPLALCNRFTIHALAVSVNFELRRNEQGRRIRYLLRQVEGMFPSALIIPSRYSPPRGWGPHYGGPAVLFPSSRGTVTTQFFSEYFYLSILSGIEPSTCRLSGKSFIHCTTEWLIPHLFLIVFILW